MKDNEVEVKVSASTQDVTQGMDGAARVVEASTARMKSAFGGMESIMSRVNVAIAGIGAVLAGGAMFRAGVEESEKLTMEAVKLSRAMGITATEAGALNIALGDVYSSAEEFTGASQMLGRQMRTNEDDLNAMGLKTRDAHGEFRNMKDVMFDAIKVLNGYKEGTDRNLAAQTMFGRGAGNLAEMLKLNTEVLDEAKKKQEELALTVGTENVEATMRYRAAMNDVGDVLSALKKAVGDALMPILTKLGQWFSEVGPAAVTVIKGAVGGLAAAFWGLKNGVIAVYEVIKATLMSAADMADRIGLSVSKLLKGDFSGASAAFDGLGGSLSSHWQKAMTNIEASSRETSEKIWNLFAPPTATPEAKSGAKSFKDPDADKAAKKKAAEEAKRLATEQKKLLEEAYAAELAALKREEDAYRNNFIAKAEIARQEAAVIAVQHGENSKEHQAALARVEAIERQHIEQMGRLAGIARQAAYDADMAQLEERQKVAQFDAEIGEISQQQLIEQKRQFLAQRQQLEIDDINRRIELAQSSPDSDPVALAELEAQKNEIMRQYAAERTELTRASVRDQMKLWDDLSNRISSLWDKGVQAMMNGTLTWKNAQKAILMEMAGMAAKMVSDEVKQRIAKKAMMAIQETAIYKALFGAQSAMQAAASSKTVAVKAVEAEAVVGANAAEAASGAAASQAPIPFFGPVLAVAAFAAIMAMVKGAKGSIKSARGGYDIPAGINPVTQLHEQEMVLPKEQADAIRNMAGGGGGSGTIMINTKGGDFIHKNDLAALLKQMRRDFKFV